MTSELIFDFQKLFKFPGGLVPDKCKKCPKKCDRVKCQKVKCKKNEWLIEGDGDCQCCDYCLLSKYIE